MENRGSLKRLPDAEEAGATALAGSAVELQSVVEALLDLAEIRSMRPAPQMQLCGIIPLNKFKTDREGSEPMVRLFHSPSRLFFAGLVFSFLMHPMKMEGSATIPSVTGPLIVTEDSYPFGAAATTVVPQDLSKYGYMEQEYFVSGKANVYDFDSAGKVAVKTPDAPYTTRILVRRPAATDRFSGNIIVEPLNASLGFDFDPQWMFSRDYFIEHGDIWIGITVKPAAAKALKKFNPDRYARISLANPLSPDWTCPKSALRYPDMATETEEGLAWDIISQVGALVRSREKKNPIAKFKAEYVYATGYSLTGAYLVTYINYIRPLSGALLKSGKPVYDGYLIGDGDGSVLFINQCTPTFPTGLSPVIIRPRKEPVISVVAQGSLLEGLQARRSDSDAAHDRYRRYEVPAASHANKLVLEFALRPGEMEKIGVPSIAPNCIGAGQYGITDFPFEYFMNAAFANLDAWARSDIPPPRAQPIEIGPGSGSPDLEVKLDRHGNAMGGLRTPYLDVPVATYFSESKPADEKSAPFCGTQGYRVPFGKEKILALYPTRESYLGKINAMVDAMVKDRSLREADGQRIKKEAEKLSVW